MLGEGAFFFSLLLLLPVLSLDAKEKDNCTVKSAGQAIII